MPREKLVAKKATAGFKRITRSVVTKDRSTRNSQKKLKIVTNRLGSSSASVISSARKNKSTKDVESINLLHEDEVNDFAVNNSPADDYEDLINGTEDEQSSSVLSSRVLRSATLIDSGIANHKVENLSRPGIDCYYLDSHDGYYIDGINGNKMRYINSSCLPNCSFEMWEYHDRSRVFIRTNKPISIKKSKHRRLYVRYRWATANCTSLPCACDLTQICRVGKAKI
jgi:hypothetical protein